MVQVLRPDGRKLMDKDGKVHDLPAVEFSGVPKKFKAEHFDIMRKLFAISQTLISKGREVPATREELVMAGVDKGDIKALERMGYVETAMLPLKVKDENVGHHKVVFLSQQGNALIRHVLKAIEKLEPEKPSAPAAELNP